MFINFINFVNLRPICAVFAQERRDFDPEMLPTMRKNRPEQSSRNPTLRVISGEPSDALQIRTQLQANRVVSALGGKRTL